MLGNSSGGGGSCGRVGMVERAVIAEAVVVVVWVQCSGGRSWGWAVLEVLKVQDLVMGQQIG